MLGHYLRIVAPHYVAAVVCEGEPRIVVDAAPILRWAVGRPAAWLLSYCAQRGYVARWLP